MLVKDKKSISVNVVPRIVTNVLRDLYLRLGKEYCESDPDTFTWKDFACGFKEILEDEYVQRLIACKIIDKRNEARAKYWKKKGQEHDKMRGYVDPRWRH
jgi:hypothetical protein